MAITCLCPQCHKTLAISEQFAGQPMRCPLCLALFQSPAAPVAASRPALGPSTAGIPSTPGNGPAPVTMRMAATSLTSEPSAALQELGNEAFSRLSPGWHMVRRGLGIIPPALIMATFVTLGSWLFLAMVRPEPKTYEMVMLLTVPVTVLATVAAVLGGALCSLVPPESGLRHRALVAAGCLLAALVLALLTLGIRIFFLTQPGKPTALEWSSYLPSDLLAFAGGVAFLFFLHGVAQFFKNQRLAQSVWWCLMGVGASPLLFLFLYLLLWTTSKAVGGDGSGLALLASLLLYGIIGADLFWFLRVLGEVRQTLEKSYLGPTA